MQVPLWPRLYSRVYLPAGCLRRISVMWLADACSLPQVCVRVVWPQLCSGLSRCVVSHAPGNLLEAVPPAGVGSPLDQGRCAPLCPMLMAELLKGLQEVPMMGGLDPSGLACIKRGTTVGPPCGSVFGTGSVFCCCVQPGVRSEMAAAVLACLLWCWHAQLCKRPG